MKTLQKALLIAMAAAVSAPALAYEAGDLIVRAGAIQVTPETTNNLQAVGPYPLGLVDVEDDTQLGLTVTYMLTPKVGLELVGATPFKHDLTLGGTTIGSVEHLPPTVMVQYFPLASSSKVQPYISAGLNYTKFWGEESRIPGVVIDVEDSLGLAAEVGVDVEVAPNVVLNAAVWKIDINTNVSAAGVRAGELEIDPLVAMVGVGYKF